MAFEGIGDGKVIPVKRRIAGFAIVMKFGFSAAPVSGNRVGGADKRLAIAGNRAPILPGAIPFQHGEFRMMGRGSLRVAPGLGQLKDPLHATR